jgi:hypothetical protein
MRIRGGRPRDVVDILIDSTLLATGRGAGLASILDIGDIEFLTSSGRRLLVKGVRISELLGALRRRLRGLET